MSASPMFTAALAYARSGFPILPCQEDTKKPHTTPIFSKGAGSATLDLASILDHWLNNPYDNIGLASDGSLVLLDIDPRNGGSLEAAERIGLPIDGYREVTVSGGWRIPLIMPPGILATRSAQPVNGVEMKALGTYALAPHSRVGGRWYRTEPDRDIWRFGSIPAAWDMLEVLVGQTSTLSSISVTPEDEAGAVALERQMRRSSDYGQGINALLDGDCDWSRYFDTAQDLSESGRDFQLARAASHFLRQHQRRDNILAALLIRHSSKASRLDDPLSYLSCVVHAAFSSRDLLDLRQHRSFANRFVLPSLISIPNYRPTTVLDGTFPIEGLRKSERTALLESSILAFAASTAPDEYTFPLGWRRLPVQMIATICGVDRKSVSRRLEALEAVGQVERYAPTRRHDGLPRKDSLVRLRR